MRPALLSAPFLLFAALGCGDGDPEDTGEAATCQDYQTVALGTLSVSDWPEGMTEALAAYELALGSWQGESCLDDSRVDIRLYGPSDDALRVVQRAPDTSASCGCLFDPDFGPDNHLSPLALIPDIRIQFDGSADPAVDGQELTGVGALFQSGSDLKLRLCGSRRSDPFEGSEYDDAHLTFRLNASDHATATITLVEVEGQLEDGHCVITSLRK